MEKRGGVFMAITCWRYGETWRSIYGDLVLEFVKECLFTTLDEVFCIEDGRGPVKTSSKSFADQVSRGHVVVAGTRVNFEK